MMNAVFVQCDDFPVVAMPRLVISRRCRRRSFLYYATSVEYPCLEQRETLCTIRHSGPL
jgi:hypothetical protein